MILQLKTKKDVTLDVVTLKQGRVRMIIEQETRNGLCIEIIGKYVKDETNELIKSFPYPIPNDIANVLGKVPIPKNATLIETRNIQLFAGVKAILAQYDDFGLSVDDWELYEEPVIEEVVPKKPE